MPEFTPFTDSDLARLQGLLDGLPAPLQPLDVSALDGYLCGVLLQPRPVPESAWLRHVADLDGRAPPASAAVEELHALVRRRHAELDHAIGQREWFDPWIYQLDAEGDPDEAEAAVSESVLPWVAGFAAATDFFPELTQRSDPELVEPLALLFMHIDPEDLEDAEALAELIQTLEPPGDLGEAVQDVVRALMLIADVTRPRQTARVRPPRAPARRTAPHRRTR